jgi:hypothetical protein
MVSERLKNAIESIKKERKRIWFNEPADLESLKKRLGVKNQSLTVVIFAYRDMAAIVKYLYVFREISRGEGFDLETVKRVTIELLKIDCARFGTTFYRLKEMERIFAEAIEALTDASTPGEYLALIEELIIYTGRFEQWIDREIPWNKFADIFMSSLE